MTRSLTVLVLLLGWGILAADPANPAGTKSMQAPVWFSSRLRPDTPIRLTKVMIVREEPSQKTFQLIFKNTSTQPIMAITAFLSLPSPGGNIYDEKGNFIGFKDHGLRILRLCFKAASEKGLIPQAEACFITSTASENISLNHHDWESASLSVEEVLLFDHTCWPSNCSGAMNDKCR